MSSPLWCISLRVKNHSIQREGVLELVNLRGQKNITLDLDVTLGSANYTCTRTTAVCPWGQVTTSLWRYDPSAAQVSRYRIKGKAGFQEQRLSQGETQWPWSMALEATPQTFQRGTRMHLRASHPAFFPGCAWSVHLLGGGEATRRRWREGGGASQSQVLLSPYKHLELVERMRPPWAYLVWKRASAVLKTWTQSSSGICSLVAIFHLLKVKIFRTC